MRMLAAVLVTLICCVPCLAYAQGGAVIIRVPDGTGNGRCVKPSEDRVWLTLRRAIVTKKGGWLKEDAQVAAILNAQLRQADGKPVAFPLITDATLRSYTNGQVSIPIEFTLIDGLLLKQPTGLARGVSIDMTLLNKQKKAAWGNALTALSEVAKKVPFPASPVSTSLTYILDFASSALDKDIQSVNNDDKAKSAVLALNFDPSGRCDQDGFERTGTLAVLQEAGIAGPSLIPVNNTNAYCWSAELSPAFLLKAAGKDPAKACSDQGFYGPKYRQVSNNYVGFFLNAVRSTENIGPAKEDRDEAMKRCEANGVSRNDCLSSTP